MAVAALSAAHDKTILVLNCGSSSLKYQLFDRAERVLAGGVVERIGEAQPWLRHSSIDGGAIEHAVAAADHRAAFARMQAVLGDGLGAQLLAVGHRVVHGGEQFRAAVLVDAQVRRAIKALAAIAPLHNPGNLLGIELADQAYPRVPQVAVFDTAFHQHMPEHAFRYAVPEAWYREQHVRRYGFHGISHDYVAQRAAALLGKPLRELNLITLHLGNGASAAAIQNGRCIDTSMGFTPLEGLVMGSRSGDLDPAIALHMARVGGMDWNSLDQALNQASGLKGLAGVSDMREILQRAAAGDAAAQLALDVYCYRIKKYIGAYYAALGRVDALVFTGGVGENAAPVRSQACAGLASLGIAIDEAKNTQALEESATIQKSGAGVAVLVVRTNEALQIARAVRALL